MNERLLFCLVFFCFCGSDVFSLCTNKCTLPPATSGSLYTPSQSTLRTPSLGITAQTAVACGDRLNQTMSHRVKWLEKSDMRATPREYKVPSPSAFVYVHVYMHVFVCKDLVQKSYSRGMASNSARGLAALNPNCSNRAGNNLKKGAADVFRSTLPLCLLLHLVSSTTIAEYS